VILTIKQITVLLCDPVFSSSNAGFYVAIVMWLLIEHIVLYESIIYLHC